MGIGNISHLLSPRSTLPPWHHPHWRRNWGTWESRGESWGRCRKRMDYKGQCSSLNIELSPSSRLTAVGMVVRGTTHPWTHLTSFRVPVVGSRGLDHHASIDCYTQIFVNVSSMRHPVRPPPTSPSTPLPRPTPSLSSFFLARLSDPKQPSLGSDVSRDAAEIRCRNRASGHRDLRRSSLP